MRLLWDLPGLDPVESLLCVRGTQMVQVNKKEDVSPAMSHEATGKVVSARTAIRGSHSSQELSQGMALTALS